MKKNNVEHFSVFDIFRAIWFFLAEDRRKYLFFSGILLVALTYDFVPPYLIGKIVNFLTEYRIGENLSTMYYLIGVLVVSSAVVAIFRLNSKKILQNISINARYRAKVWGFERLLDFSLSWHQKENTGNKAQRIITGSDSIREWTRDLCNSVLPTVISFVGTAITCSLLKPSFLFFFVYYILIFLMIEFYYDRKISILSDKVNKSMENASGTFVESASNILSVKALGAKDCMTSNVVIREQLSKSLSKERTRLGFNKWVYFQIHNSISWGIFLLFIGFAVIHGQISVGLVLTFAMYFASMRTNVTQFVEQFQQMIERKSSLGRMMPFFWNDNKLTSGNTAFPTGWDKITINSVNFRYGDDLAVKGLNLQIKRNEKIGIAGHSGSGKSTLIKLLLGLYKVESGTILFGDVPLEEIKYEDLTSHISIVLQETELFNFSLKENITMMRVLGDEEFQNVCQIACIEELIARLPNGAETIIGEKGYSLSGGERQRIGIARAICKNAKIILLDEATSALDSETEHKIMNGLLGSFSKDKTILIVAHRTSTLKDTDRLLVFEKGSIVEDSSFDKLTLDKSTRFSAFHEKQFAG
jgi:ABC-type multidrug transport system fused ATPase/permease subunit